MIVAFLFISVLVFSWFVEDSKWQLSGRISTILIVLTIPFFILEWRFQIFGFGSGRVIAVDGLSRLILFLCAIKLLQKKTDRDWVFVYIISFFEVLLSAGLTISPLFLLSLFGYLLFTISAVIVFEIRKTSHDVFSKVTRQEPLKSNVLKHPFAETPGLVRFPRVAVIFLFLITLFAVPLYFTLPRVGGAGLGSDLMGGGSQITGFSDSVNLGEIGKLKQSQETVMRVRIDGVGASKLSKIYWRGVVLDSFDNVSWNKSQSSRVERIIQGSNGFFNVNFPRRVSTNVTQTFYLEPIGTPVLFSLSKPISVQGNFEILRKDPDDSLRANGIGFERSNYVVRSDPSLPERKRLETDSGNYELAGQRFLQLPTDLDPRIPKLASDVVERAGAKNMHEAAEAIETFLRNEYGYSLDMKAGGSQPLADFLFNVREGHCEYFSTAMAIMLRTRGIATRVVNGFQQGEFNQTAGVYVVKQKDAHSWIEVYFPETNSWITFDPTPSEGRFSEAAASSIIGRFNKYLEALEAFWIQYFVSYDSVEQRSLFERTQNRFSNYKDAGAGWIQSAQRQLELWWEQVRGDQGVQVSLLAVGKAAGYSTAVFTGFLFLIWLFRRIKRFALWQHISKWLKRKNGVTIVEFYARMQTILQRKGLSRSFDQTPLEFAFKLGIPEAVKLTKKYNQVRFGEKELSHDESNEIEKWLARLAATKVNDE